RPHFPSPGRPGSYTGGTRRRCRIGTSPLALSFPLFQYHSEIQEAAMQVHMNHASSDLVAEPVSPFGSAADKAVCGFIEIIVIVGERADVDKPLDRQVFCLSEKAVVGDTCDHDFQRQTDTLAQVSQELRPH